MNHNKLYGDKAYHRSDAKDVRENKVLTELTPVKKQKSQSYVEPQDQWLSTAVSRVRQPIEALFSCIEQQTGNERSNGACIRQVGRSHVFLESFTS